MARVYHNIEKARAEVAKIETITGFELTGDVEIYDAEPKTHGPALRIKSQAEQDASADN